MTRRNDARPDALEHFGAITEHLGDRTPAVFLDFDGTLAPIVPHPDDAALSDRARETVRRLAGLCPVAVVSGRDRRDVRARVGLDLVYAGSHGFDIAGPKGIEREHPEARRLLGLLDEVENGLRGALEGIQGALVERKRYTIAVHSRNVLPERERDVEEAVDRALAARPELRKGTGKKVFELQPALDWHKGRAVSWLLAALELDRGDVVPMYVGDDTTDEDAFRELGERGIGIAVREDDTPTAAAYVVAGVDEATLFLERLVTWLERR